MDRKHVHALDAAFLEFDAAMTRAAEVLAEHRALIDDFDGLVERQASARAAGSAFVFEAAMAMAELRGPVTSGHRRAAVTSGEPASAVLDLMRPMKGTIQ